MHTCSECTYLKIDGGHDEKDGKFWCESKGEWVYANQAECWNYCTAYSRSSSVADSYSNYSKNKQSSSSGCYITTITCNILGMKDDSYSLKKLRKFREEVLQKKEEYKKLLVEYDIVGPIIASKLSKEKDDSLVIATNLYNFGICKVIDAINDKNELEAVRLYTVMTQLLIDGYNIDRKPTEEEVKQAVITKSGHGRYVK